MTENDIIVMSVINANVNSENKWNVSVREISELAGLELNVVTQSLKNLDDSRYIDQFVTRETEKQDAIFGLRLVDKSEFEI